MRGLVQADRDVIYRATANLRPRPPRDLIARWQEGARSLLAEATPDDWQMVASFVVVFFQRRAGDAWERRVEAERTEVEPERNTGPPGTPGHHDEVTGRSQRLRDHGAPRRARDPPPQAEHRA